MRCAGFANAAFWAERATLQAAMVQGAGNFTPWLELAWARIWRCHRAEVLDLQSELGSRGPVAVE